MPLSGHNVYRKGDYGRRMTKRTVPVVTESTEPSLLLRDGASLVLLRDSTSRFLLRT